MFPVESSSDRPQRALVHTAARVEGEPAPADSSTDKSDSHESSTAPCCPSPSKEHGNGKPLGDLSQLLILLRILGLIGKDNAPPSPSGSPSWRWRGVVAAVLGAVLVGAWLLYRQARA